MKFKCILIIVIINMISCDISKKESNHQELNGIYALSEKGNPYTLARDSSIILHVDTHALISSERFKDVQIQYIYSTGESILFIQLDSLGCQKFKKLSKQYIGKRLAIVIDDVLLSAPITHSEIPNGQIQISGVEEKLLKRINKSF